MPSVAELNTLLATIEASFLFRLVLMMVGGVLGLALLWFDKNLLYKEYVEETQLHAGQFGQRLITRSLFFILAYLPLAIFVATSSGSSIGNGLILGIGLGLSLEMLKLRRQPEIFHDYFLYQLKRELSQKEVDQMVVGFIVFLAVILALGLF